MVDIKNLMAGRRLLEVRQSPFSGELAVVQDLAFGTYIQAENLTQSGGLVEQIWEKGFGKLVSKDMEVKTCLILGLGGGSIAKLARSYWPESQIIGVEIDKDMIDLGQKYMKLDEHDVEIVLEDAEKFLKKNRKKFDLICVDMYTGDKVPEKFTTDKFTKDIKKITNKDGAIIFNRLFYGGKRSSANSFGDKLEKHFPDMEVVYPEANMLFICSNNRYNN